LSICQSLDHLISTITQFWILSIILSTHLYVPHRKHMMSLLRAQQTSSFCWVHLHWFHLKTETESSLHNKYHVFEYKTGWWILSKIVIVILIYHHHKPIDRLVLET
jgi:hypothetical protein